MSESTLRHRRAEDLGGVMYRRTAAGRSALSPNAIALTSVQLDVLLLVNGRRGASEIARLCGSSTVERVTSLLADLLERGYVEVVESVVLTSSPQTLASVPRTP